MTGTIFSVQRYSIHDGPGIRTTAFFKGCDLRCLWCHNPESQRMSPELMLYRDKCVGCGKCRDFCKKAFTDGCEGCGKCATVCKSGARELCGYDITAKELAGKLSSDADFYETSGGGITLSGGEPLLQSDFAKEVLILCKERGIHTAVETAGNLPFTVFEKVMPYVELFLYDIKAIDPELHKRLTGVSNERILENAEKLTGSANDVIFRMPVVPGYNDNEIGKVSGFAKSLGAKLELLPYHNMCSVKYAALGRDFKTAEARVPTKDEIRILSGGRPKSRS